MARRPGHEDCPSCSVCGLTNCPDCDDKSIACPIIHEEPPMTAEPLAPLTRVRDHSHNPAVVDWLNGSTDVLDGLIVDETVTFTPGPRPIGPVSEALWNRALPPVGWVPVHPDTPTPIFDQVQDGWSWRTVKGRKSRLTMTFDAFVAASRAQHSTWHGRRT